MIVKSEKVEMPSDYKEEDHSKTKFSVPGNYETCLDLLELLKEVFKVTGIIHPLPSKAIQ